MIGSEEKRVRYLWEELIKCLVVMSLPGPDQLEILGDRAGNIMAVEFDTYYRLQKTQYQTYGLHPSGALALLNQLDQQLHTYQGEASAVFRNSVLTHPDWAKVRQLARASLQAVGRGEQGIVVKHVTIKEYYPDGKSRQVGADAEVELILREGKRSA